MSMYCEIQVAQLRSSLRENGEDFGVEDTLKASPHNCSFAVQVSLVVADCVSLYHWCIQCTDKLNTLCRSAFQLAERVSSSAMCCFSSATTKESAVLNQL